jgi:hypothetical protein
MSSQIFKKQIPNDVLIQLLDTIAIKTEKGYIINNTTYKKGLFNDKLTDFINNCKPYYHTSKLKYLDRKLTYNSFITVVRQICNFNKITYTSQIKYDKSTYDIVYYLYFN